MKANPAPAVPGINEHLEAFKKVQAGIVDLKKKYFAVTKEISLTEQEIDLVFKAFLPFDDLKAALLDYIDVTGKAYGAKAASDYLKGFATHVEYFSQIQRSPDFLKPLRYSDLVDADSLEMHKEGEAQFINGSPSLGGDDRLLYFFFGELVKSTLAKVMAEWTPEDLGYDKIDVDLIGLPRAERKVKLEALRAKLGTLEQEQGNLAAALLQLGFSVK